MMPSRPKLGLGLCAFLCFQVRLRVFVSFTFPFLSFFLPLFRSFDSFSHSSHFQRKYTFLWRHGHHLEITYCCTFRRSFLFNSKPQPLRIDHRRFKIGSMVQLVSKSLALSSVLVSLLSCVQGAPTKSRPLLSAPITHAGDISGAKAASPPSYIISLESKTVDPQGRGEWLDSVLLTGGHTKRSHIASELRLEWNEAVFNGFAGQFSDAELRTLSSQPEVQWIQQGTSILFSFHSVTSEI